MSGKKSKTPPKWKLSSKAGQVTRLPKLKPTHPGELLRDDLMPAAGLTPRDLAKALKLPRTAVAGILLDKRPVTVDIAIRLGTFFGNGPELWLNMQRAVDLWTNRKEYSSIKLLKSSRSKPDEELGTSAADLHRRWLNDEEYRLDYTQLSDHWHYQIVRRKLDNKGAAAEWGEGVTHTYAIHEAFRNSKGEIFMVTDDPKAVIGESVEAVMKNLHMMASDAAKYGVVDHDGPFANPNVRPFEEFEAELDREDLKEAKKGRKEPSISLSELKAKAAKRKSKK